MAVNRLRWGFAAATLAFAPLASPCPSRSIDDFISPLTQSARRRLEFEVPRERKADEVRWTGDWYGALDEATRRNVPVLAVLSDDQSSGFKSMSSAVYSKPGFGALSQKVVLLAAFDGKAHPSKPRVAANASIDWCDLFDCACDEHRASYVKVRDEFAQREYWNPLHVFVGADGLERARAEGHQLTIERLEEELAHANKDRAHPSFSYGEYAALLASVRALIDQREKRGGSFVHRELGKLLIAEQKGIKDASLPRPLKTAALAQWIGELQAALIEEAEGQIEEALEVARAGDRAAARKRLANVVRGMKGLPVAADAQKQLDKLPADDPKSPPRKGGG